MIRKYITINEAILLGMLTLLVLIAVFHAPWKGQALKYSESQYRTNSFGILLRGSPKQMKNTSTWRINTEYSPKRGVLQLNISHKNNAPLNDLKLIAEFDSYRSVMPVFIAILYNQSEGIYRTDNKGIYRTDNKGIYRTDNIWLTKGDWLMSLTGRRQSEFIFRSEKVLHVD